MINLYRDGLNERVDSLPVVSTNREGHTIESYCVDKKPRFFVTLKDSHWCAHGSSVAEAVADAIWKDPARRPPLEKIKSEIVEHGTSRLISLNEFRLLTGACSEGCRVALARAGLDGSPMTAKSIRDSVSQEWGSKLISILGWEEVLG